jgi:hypothetical protein
VSQRLSLHTSLTAEKFNDASTLAGESSRNTTTLDDIHELRFASNPGGGSVRPLWCNIWWLARCDLESF